MLPATALALLLTTTAHADPPEGPFEAPAGWITEATETEMLAR